MSWALPDLIEPITFKEARASMMNVLAIVGVRTTDWRPGAVTRSIIAAAAVMIAFLSRMIAFVARSGFIEYAKGAWLTLVARYVYGVERFGATFATGKVTLTNAGGGVYTYAAGELTLSTAAGKQYRNVSGFTLPIGPSAVTIDVSAVEIGAASTAYAGEINSAQGLPPAFVTVANAAPVTGSDEEGDEDLVLRCRSRLGALSPNGPADAYAHFARSATRADGSPIGVTRVRPTKDGFGNLTLYCGTPAGGLTGTVGDLATDLGAVDDLLQRNCAPLGVNLKTRSAVVTPCNIVYVVSMYNTPGVTAAMAKAAIDAEIARFFGDQPIGGHRASGSGYVYGSVLKRVIGETLVNGARLPIYRVSFAPDDDTNWPIGLSGAPVLGIVSVNSQIIMTAPEET